MKPRSAYIPRAIDSDLVTVRVEIARVRGRKTLHSPLANKETGARGGYGTKLVYGIVKVFFF